MPRIDFLSYTGQVLGCIAGAVLVALAINGIKATASISNAPITPDSSGSADAVYPVRVGLTARGQSGSATYPLRVPLRAIQSRPAKNAPSHSSLMLVAALRLPEGVFDLAATYSARELASIEDQPDSDDAKEQSLTTPPVRQASVLPEISGQSLANVLDVKYDLDAQFSEADGLAIRKPLIVNGAAKGKVTLQIVRDSTICSIG